MAKLNHSFICADCQQIHSKWSGQCFNCGAWNSIMELKSEKKKTNANLIEFSSIKEVSSHVERIHTQINEFDTVCGGGLVKGSAILLTGDPGIGKSTLLLQIACSLSTKLKIAYISGEEAVEQICIRARRLGFNHSELKIASNSCLEEIIATIDHEYFDLVIIDSVQTLMSLNYTSSIGALTQLRFCTTEIIKLFKEKKITTILVGHVTKDGNVAGPKVIEHLVDAVISFEGERGYPYRILRASKNRYGATDEIGIFEMKENGLIEITNPSSLFISSPNDDPIGSCIFPTIEGVRPLLVEIQSLVAKSFLDTPKRSVVGWDNARLSMIIAVLETKCGLNFSKHDIYLNVSGGIRLVDPAADLSVAISLISSLMNVSPLNNSVAIGEISLTGRVKPASRCELRIKEAIRLGFTNIISPDLKDENSRYNIITINSIEEMVNFFIDKKNK